MRLITEQEANDYANNGFKGHKVGWFCEYGAIIGDEEFVIVDEGNGTFYLAHRNEFEFSNVFVRPFHPENISPLPNFDDVFVLKSLTPKEES